MKRFLYIFILLSGLIFGQERTVFRQITYNDVVQQFNKVLHLKNENLDQNLDRCQYIIAESKKKGDDNTALAFALYYKALKEAKIKSNSEQPFFTIYKADGSYEFYSSENKFIGRMYKEKLEEQIDINGDNPNTYLENYFYMISDE
ncbi:hypothetical protein HZP54_16915 [Elizabethkingia anophelis]|nr:hypothetical protein [Elizabethkingia anophelis]